MTDAIVIGGSKGIGRAIADALRADGCGVLATSRADIDTSSRASVRAFVEQRGRGGTDVLVLNTGGPPPKEFGEVGEDEWDRYHDQLFTGFCSLLRGVRVRRGGYIFAITSSVVREPSPRLVVSGAYRAAFSSVFKVLSESYARDGISCVNIAPGPTNTGRMRELVEDIDAFSAGLPMGRLGEPCEIGALVASIVRNRIKYLSGEIINVDGAASSGAF